MAAPDPASAPAASFDAAAARARAAELFCVPDSQLPRARGALDALAPAEDGAGTLLRGWIFHPDFRLDGARVLVDGAEVGSSALTPREDLGALFPHLPAMAQSGFAVSGVAPVTRRPIRTVTIVGTAAGKPAAVFQTHRRAHPAGLPAPAEDLLERVSGNRDPASFHQIGLDATMELLRAVHQHRGLDRVQHLLDWGCGPGRISAQVMNLFPAIALAGCDLDAAAIAWCNANLRAGAFRVTAPRPPLPYPAASFDAIVAVSVMTHLDWPLQRRWLAEIRRLLRPGGIFGASVQGGFAAAFFPHQREQLEERGFIADARDNSLRGIAPRGYYRCTFQTAAFTRRAWNDELSVIDYQEAGLTGFHDLVIARRDA